ncbi:MAG: MotE family protein [Roseobacter sp.]
MKKIFRKSGRGSVLLISFLLIGSAAVRVGSEAGKAVATESQLLGNTETGQAADPPNDGIDHAAISEMLAAFQKREARILEMERSVEERKKALEVADLEITKRLEILQNAEESLSSLLAIADTAAEDDLTTLTSVYENMKPKDAAALFEEMEPDFAAGFLGRMRPDAAAGIMAGLSPKAAYTISVILAGRNAQAPKG